MSNNNEKDYNHLVLKTGIGMWILVIMLLIYLFCMSEVKTDIHKFKEGDTVKAFMYNGFHKECVIEERCWYDKEKQSFVDYKTNEKSLQSIEGNKRKEC